jgi:hypothetical protein
LALSGNDERQRSGNAQALRGVALEMRFQDYGIGAGVTFTVHADDEFEMMKTATPAIEITAREAAATARVEKMVNAAPSVGVNLFDLELVRRRLNDHEAELLRTASIRRRKVLERVIAADAELLVSGYKKLEAAIERRATT